MLDLIYITHLQAGRQKALAYAFGLAKAFSAPLSLLPSSSLGKSKGRKMSIWRPTPDQHEKRANRETTIYRSRKGNLPLYIMGKPSQLVKSNYPSYQIIQQLVDLGAPLLLLPFEQAFQGIRKVLFARNAPGLTDHKVKHLIAANFLPRAFKMEDRSLTRIHWNNISHIPNTPSLWLDFSCPNLDTVLKEHEIDLTIYPISTVECKEEILENAGLLSANHPLLFLPLSTETRALSHGSACLTA